jgi:polyisoprenoid-binding protein YceI
MKSTRNAIVLLLIVMAVFSAQITLADTYDIDNSHSSVGFKIKHLAISNVKGSFTSFEGAFDFVAGQPRQWNVEVSIDMKSVDTGDEDRDDHLRAEDFFDVEKFPTMVFKSTGVKMDDDEEGKLMGTLTMHGVTLPVTLDIEFNGAITDPWGNERVGFSATGKINRKDWGLSYGKALESGGLVIGNDVKISLEIEGVKRK